MKITKTINIIVVLASLFINQAYASLTFNLNSIANGTMPTSTSPWLTAEFVDSTGGGVDLILTSHLNVSSEYITGFAFNVNPSKNLSISPIVFTDFGTPTSLTISQGYDYVKKETPEVIKEFLLWRLTESCIFTGGWVAFACLLFIVAYKLKKFSLVADSRDDIDYAIAGKWILSFLASIIIIITLGVNGMTIGKILVAPRVYIIEYVVNTIQMHNY